jgi:hypothetical protein
MSRRTSLARLSLGTGLLLAVLFFDGIISHPSIKEAILGWQAASVLLSDKRFAGLDIEGVVFEEYSGAVFLADGSATVDFLGATEGLIVPLGTRNTFKRYLAPAARVDTINTLGKPYYAWQDLRQDKFGIDIKVESNTLPICLRPQLLVKLTTT